MSKPFLKWVGGKTQLLPELIKAFEDFNEPYPNTYYEPFLGGGALFFKIATRARRAFISDINRELIEAYVAVRDNVGDVIALLKEHVYEKDYYYHVRAQNPKKLNNEARAARMIYLNKTCFNGLYRVNSRGEFNVPFGRYKNPTICDENNLLACSDALQEVNIECSNFDAVLTKAGPGDFVYFDPPYIPLSDTANFTSYHKSGFDMQEQRHLADVFECLVDGGVSVMLSNADHQWIHERYAEYNIRVVKARRSINSKGGRRGAIGEVIIRGEK